MTQAEIMESFPGNTVVAEVAVGTAYAYVQQGGTAAGVHPAYGEVTGQWNVGSDGVVCVTWPVGQANEIKNCSKTISLGKNLYNWANQVIRLESGDPQNLAN